MTKTDLREILAANVRTFRHRNDVSQDEFAHRCGLHRTYIGSVERCERNVTLATLELLAKAMGVEVDGGNGKQHQRPTRFQIRRQRVGDFREPNRSFHFTATNCR